MNRQIAAATLFVIASFASAPGLAQGSGAPGDAARVNVFGTVRFAGSATADVGRISISNDMAPGVGGGVRLEVPLMDYIAVGGVFQVVSLRADGDDQRDAVLDISGWVKGRYVIPSVGRGLEVYLGLAMGLSIAPNNDLTTGETEVGWNLAFLPGAQYFVTDTIGLLFEFGFTRHHFNIDDLEFNVLQGTMNVGLSLVF